MTPPSISLDAVIGALGLAAEHAPHARLVCEIDGQAFGCDTAIADEMLWELNSATPDMVMPVESALGLGICKVAVNGLGAPLHVLIDAIGTAVGEAVTVIPDGGGTFLNIVPPGTSKVAALRRLIASDTPGRGMLAFGDDLGDLEMLLLAEHGVAMANGHPEVLRSAHYTTLSNAEDGVAHVLERLIARFG